MSLEVTVITSLLATALGSSKVAESVVELFKKYYNEKKAEEPKEDASVFFQSSIPPVAPEAPESPEAPETPPCGDDYSKKVSDADIATDAAIRALNETHSSVASIRNERMRQARLSFNTALILMIIGVVIIFIGVGMVIVGNNIESGIITVVSGTISEVISVLVFRFNKETNNRLDETRKELSRIEMSKVGLSLAKEISNLEKRDNAIAELAQKVQAYG